MTANSSIRSTKQQVLYYKSPIGNFGDDLNEWLWEKLFNDGESDAMVGIGSILTASLEPWLVDKSRLLVLGAGIRGFDRLPRLCSQDLRGFCRGPISATAMNRDGFGYISDGAYAVRLTREFQEIKRAGKKYDYSFMPYYKTSSLIDWRRLCLDLGVNYISPHCEDGVQFTLMEIAQSKHLIAEAMHGAILADAFRVPWVRVGFASALIETSAVSELKWLDWGRSVSVSVDSFLLKKGFPSYVKSTPRLLKGYATIRRRKICYELEESMKKLLESKNRFVMSSDTTISRVQKEMGECLLESGLLNCGLR